MNLKELMNKIEKLNKMNKEMDFGYEYYLVVSEKYGKPIYIYNKKDINKVSEYYIEEVATKIINSELKKIDRYTYSIDEYEIHIGVK